MIGSGIDESRAKASSASFLFLTRFNQTVIEFEVLSQRVDDGIGSGLKKALSSPEKILADALVGVRILLIQF